MKYFLIGLIPVLLCLYGWIHNIVEIFHHGYGIDGELVARVVGVFIVPIGVIAGYF